MLPDRHPHDALFHIFGALVGGPSGWLTVGLSVKWRALLARRWGDDELEMVLTSPLILGVIAGFIGSSLAQAFARRRLARWHPALTYFGGAWAGGAVAAGAILLALGA